MPTQTPPIKTHSPVSVVTLDEVAGCLAYQGKPKTLEDMEKEFGGKFVLCHSID
jgi:ArsR family metal-binding transcriptional regulator